jgi:hypothetical protein
MPIHDWTRVDAGLFHAFHQRWISALSDALNCGGLPPDKPLTLISYDACPLSTAYVEPVAAGDVVPSMPQFLMPEYYVPTPLEATVQTTWSVFPAELKGLLEGPAGGTGGD